MRRMAIIGGALALVCGLVLAGQATTKGQSPEEAAKAEVAGKAAAPSKLDIIKKLAGDWVEVKDGKPTDKVVSTYRVTAGGSAVEEVIFRGTPHEMITLYHLDGNDLMLTHYCVTGNQPVMKAEKQTDPSRLVFQCAGGTNMKSENDEHMHRATIVWKDDDHIDSEWVEVKDGKNVFTAAFSLARK